MKNRDQKKLCLFITFYIESMNEVMPVVDRSVDWAACGDSISRNLNPNYGTDRSDQKSFCQRNIAESFSGGRKKHLPEQVPQKSSIETSPNGKF